MAVTPALSARQRILLREMGIGCWQLRDRGEGSGDGDAVTTLAAPVAPAQAPSAPTLPAPDPATGRANCPPPPGLEALRAAVAGCRACDLHRTRTHTVFGVGNPAPRWMIIGEAPGAEEDRQGEPFVGAAGQLLTEMLRAVGLQRSDVFIANILKCRPPENRDPRPEEIAACAAHLQAQLRLVSPRLILAVGRIAAQSLLQQTLPVGQLRGRVHAYGAEAIPLVVTYHPAYLLRSPAEKRKAWDDLRLARRMVDPRGP